jgi:hypothetical protein
MEFGDAFDALMDESNYMDAAQVLAGLAGSVVARNGVDSRFDLPDEVYGLGVAGGAGTGEQTAARGWHLPSSRAGHSRSGSTNSVPQNRQTIGGRPSSPAARSTRLTPPPHDRLSTRSVQSGPTSYPN